MHPELEATMARGRAAGVTHRVARERDRNGRTLRLEPEGDVVSFATCSYLGLERDERLAQRAKAAIDRFGVSFSASRCFVTSALYAEAEELLAAIFGRPVVLAGSTTLAHGAALPILVGARDVVLLDRQVHHSVQTAVAALGARRARVPVAHSDLDALEAAIKEAVANDAHHIWYCADGIYSMFGDRLPIAGLSELMARYPQLYAYLDDAHGMSWCGTHGAGSLIDAPLPRERTVIATSLSKGFGCAGGVLAVPDVATKHRIENLGPSLMFSIQLPPPVLGAICASARIHLGDEIFSLQATHRDRRAFARALVTSHPIVGPRAVKIDGEPTPVQYVVLGTADDAIEATARLLDLGFLVNPVAFPAVPRDAGGIRLTITRCHTTSDIQRLVAAIGDVVHSMQPDRLLNMKESA
ncbi:MAG TPA: aminotransferase class I/II-fold pyridoxal phosphate-dependent enzyme [Kofleriaceae bacterium]|nr:aminotransferase class I/II-fold pyridoxal phosphate-dependent enzyme [Kofleriaceae bacterium]